jgi:hypothetical protein
MLVFGLAFMVTSADAIQYSATHDTDDDEWTVNFDFSIAEDPVDFDTGTSAVAPDDPKITADNTETSNLIGMDNTA